MNTDITRKEWPAWAHYGSLIPLYLLLLPTIKVLGLLGYWPQKIIPKVVNKSYVWPADFEPGNHDVVACSYFKSGTNWLLQITTQIAYKGRAEFKHIHDLVPWPELNRRRPFAVDVRDLPEVPNSPTGLRILKTHLEIGKVPYNDKARYICLVRDPKSVFVSGYRFIKHINLGPLMPSVRDWLDLFMSDTFMFGGWARHVAACWALREKPNVLFLTYEDLKADLPGKVAEIAKFMGVELSPAELAAVIEQSGFEHMKQIEYKFDPVRFGPPWANPKGAMIREGARKNTDTLITRNDRDRIDDYCRRDLKRLHCDFPYDDYYGS